LFKTTDIFATMNTQKTITVSPSVLYAYSDALAQAGNYHIGPKTAYAIMRNMRFVAQQVGTIRSEVVAMMEKHGALKDEVGNYKQQNGPQNMPVPVFETDEKLQAYNEELRNFNANFAIKLPVYMVTDQEMRLMHEQVPASILLGLEPMIIFEDEQLSNKPTINDDLHEESEVSNAEA